MKNYSIGPSIAVGLIYFLIMGSANAWTIDQSYDNETIGQGCANWGSSQSKVSNDEAASGTKSCAQKIDAGATGFGQWGGIINFPSDLHKGDEVWIRLRTFFPVNFDYNAQPALKFLRVRIKNDAYSNGGYNDLYIFPNTGSNSNWAHGVIYEGNLAYWERFGDPATDRPKHGVWDTYEFYIKFDPLNVDEGGNGRMRVWKNGELLVDSTSKRTMILNDDHANTLNVFTWWNNGAPKTQTMYIDDLLITDEEPLNKDTHGNPFIGMGGFVPAPAPPKPPTIIP